MLNQSVSLCMFKSVADLIEKLNNIVNFWQKSDL